MEMIIVRCLSPVWDRLVTAKGLPVCRPQRVAVRPIRPASRLRFIASRSTGENPRQLPQVIVGQEQVIEELLISLFSRGHCLLEGVPGLAKTLMISTLARTLNLTFSRIQFTPDLMPADITGTEIIEENRPPGPANGGSWKAPCSRT